MSYFGKLFGGLAGLVTGKWPLVLFGLVLGHQFDRGVQRFRRQSLPRGFSSTLFAVMGHLSKSDGRVTEDEIRVARLAMHSLQLDGEATKAAMRSFNSGKQPGFPLDEALSRLKRESADEHAVGRRMIELLLPVLFIKNEASAEERRVLWQVSQAFGLSRVELAQLEAANRWQGRFERAGIKPTAARDDATAAFTTLGLAADASDQEIKTAYRRLMNRHHPDKLAGSNADAKALEAAAQKTRTIREAYELLRDRRGFK